MSDLAYHQRANRIGNACGLFLIVYTLAAVGHSVTTGSTLFLSVHPQLPVMAGTILVCCIFITASLLTIWITTITELVIFSVSIVWSLTLCLMNGYLRLIGSEFDLEFLFGLDHETQTQMSLLSTGAIILIHCVTISVAFDLACTQKLSLYAFRFVVCLVLVVLFAQLLAIYSALTLPESLLFSLPEAIIYVAVLYVLKIINDSKNKRPERALAF
ncbi:hypothetical protein [Marivivens niveibacter]|uniref:hypothetical protein n=1 Tax=Marivivens niveibacter TaxID=1930667 RepID=UPI001054B165|nr:hypothetical protein [Marivivens niveibacter]